MVELFPSGVWGFQWGSAGKGSAGKNPLYMSLFDALFLETMLLEVIFLRRFLQRSLVSKWSAENEGFIRNFNYLQDVWGALSCSYLVNSVVRYSTHFGHSNL